MASRIVASALRTSVGVAAMSCVLLAASLPQQILGSQRRVAPLDTGTDEIAGTGDRTASARSVLSLSPAEEFRIDAGNNFDPEALHRTYSLSNTSPASVTWTASASRPWVTFSGPTSGTLASGDSVDVSVDVDPLAASKDSAESSALLSFADTATQTSVTASLSVSQGFTLAMNGGSGWTRFLESADTRKVYVSRTGNDQNDGLSPATAKLSIAAGQALLRHGYPDWLLLERGGVWHESLGQWKKAGRSPTEPMLVSTYGTAAARPLLETTGQSGIWTNGGGGSPAHIDNLAIVGIHFHADGYTGGGNRFGAQFLQPSSHVLIEDCVFRGYGVNLVFQGYGGRHSDFKLRRSVVVDAWTVHSIGGHSQGLYAYAVDGLLIEESVFDHNGWNEAVPGAGADIYSHNLYIDNDNTSVVVRGNIIANASSHGMQLRPGGSAVNNVFVRNSIALSVGGGNNPEAGGVTANVIGNAIVDGKNIDAANPRGWGLWFANISSGRVRRNLIANNTLGTQPVAVTIAGHHMGNTQASIGVHNLAIEGNILFNWAGSIRIEGDSWQISNLRLGSNDVQSTNSPDRLIEEPVASSLSGVNSGANRFFSALAPANAWARIGTASHPMTYWCGQVGDTTSTMQQVGYSDPNRSVASYNAALGGAADVTSFLAEARKQSSTNWRSEYTGVALALYLRQGY